MTTITGSTTVQISKDTAWNILADLSGVQNYNPSVLKAYYVSDHREGLDAARICELVGGVTVREAAVEWQDGETYTLTVEFIEGMAPPIRDMHGTLSLHSIDDQTTRLDVAISYDPKFGPMGALMNVMMIRNQFEKTIAGMLTGFEHHALTGEYVDREVYRALRAATAA